MKCLLELYGLKVKSVMQYIESEITLFLLAAHSIFIFNPECIDYYQQMIQSEIYGLFIAMLALFICHMIFTCP